MHRTPAIVLGCLAFTLPAQAQTFNPMVRTTNVTVSYGDLDVSKDHDARILLARMKTAAREACGPAPEGPGLAVRRSYDPCVRRAMDGAVTRVSSLAVQRVYAGEIANPNVYVASR